MEDSVLDSGSELKEYEEQDLESKEDIEEEINPNTDTDDEDPFDLENESKWVINAIVFMAVAIFLIPLAAKLTTELDAVAMVIVLMYVVYTPMSGQAVDPPDPKEPPGHL